MDEIVKRIKRISNVLIKMSTYNTNWKLIISEDLQNLLLSTQTLHYYFSQYDQDTSKYSLSPIPQHHTSLHLHKVPYHIFKTPFHSSHTTCSSQITPIHTHTLHYKWCHLQELILLHHILHSWGFFFIKVLRNVQLPDPIVFCLQLLCLLMNLKGVECG